jgi:hypothetical protein
MPSNRIFLRQKRWIVALYQRRPIVRSQVPDRVEGRSNWPVVVLAWLPVTLPLLWGIWQTVKKAAVLFR